VAVSCCPHRAQTRRMSRKKKKSNKNKTLPTYHKEAASIERRRPQRREIKQPLTHEHHSDSEEPRAVVQPSNGQPLRQRVGALDAALDHHREHRQREEPQSTHAEQDWVVVVFVQHGVQDDEHDEAYPHAGLHDCAICVRALHQSAGQRGADEAAHDARRNHGAGLRVRVACGENGEVGDRLHRKLSKHIAKLKTESKQKEKQTNRKQTVTESQQKANRNRKQGNRNQINRKEKEKQTERKKERKSEANRNRKQTGSKQKANKKQTQSKHKANRKSKQTGRKKERKSEANRNRKQTKCKHKANRKRNKQKERKKRSKQKQKANLCQSTAD
jgi:hypothetical protein